MGSLLAEGIAGRAQARGIALAVSGFGTAFALHFTGRTEFHNYRDTLGDDQAKLKRFLLLALEEGVQFVPDGRAYTSTAHTEADIQESVEAVDRALGRLE